MSHQEQSAAVSAAIFCPQNRPPKPAYLEDLRNYLRQHPILAPFQQAILDLPKTWEIFAKAHPAVAAMEQGPQYTGYFRDWIMNNNAVPLTEIMSGIIALPMLTAIQIVQYFQYLEARSISHDQFLREIQHGGTQGFCAGLLPVMAIAPSQTEEDVVKNACACLRIALGIGAYGELGDDQDNMGPTTVALRLKYPGQADELVSKFQGLYVSAVADPLSISVVGPTKLLSEFKAYAESQGVPTTELYLRGKVHNPENEDLCGELCTLCDEVPELRLPDSTALRVPVRSNATGELLPDGTPLSHEIVKTALVSRCEWYSLLESLSSVFQKTGQTVHGLAMFGTGGKNCVGPMAFEKKGVKIVKHDVVSYIDKTRAPAITGPNLESFPADSIAIVGAACRLPGASSLDELWDVLSTGTIKATRIPAERFDPSRVSRNAPDAKAGGDGKQRTWYGNFLDDVDSFDNAFFGVSPREALYMDPQQRLLLETAYEALDESGYLRHHSRNDFDNVGCFLGSTYTEYLENTTAYSPTAYTATGTIRAFQSGKISYFFGWSGPSEVIDTACSASLVAIHRACRAIQAGECPMALAGGVNIITGMHNFLDLGKAGFLSHTGQCKPFDAAADGYCRADGVGLVVLKSLREAVANGDNVLGVIPGIATNHGGLSSSITVPYSRAQTELFGRVLERAKMSSAQVSYIEAHGTGTQVGDPIEIGSIRKVFGGSQEERDPLYLGSIKANVGHSETAAGVGSVMKVLAMLQRSQIPPLAGFKALNPKIPPLEPDSLHINAEVLSWTAPVKAALVNSYGAAGSNSALICTEAPRSTTRTYLDATAAGVRWPIFISAASAESLQAYASKLAGYMRKNPSLSIRDLSLTLYERRKHHPVRWIGVERDVNSLAEVLESGLDNTFEMPTSLTKKPVVLVFSGQSKQTIQLKPSWYRSFPRLRSYLEQCNDLLTTLGYRGFLPSLFQSEPVADVVALQCGTFAVQYACAKCWIDSGLEIQAVVGHSFGELTAMAVSGVLSLDDALKLVAARASLMQTKWGPERGTMLAVHTSAEAVAELVASVQGLEIACFNGPKSQVVVGSQSAIEQAEAVLSQDPRFANQKLQHQRVSVSHGFHSVFTESILEDLDQFAKTLNYETPKIPLESCTKVNMDHFTSDRIVQHTRDPVYFSDAISRLESRLGPCVFVEAGTGSPIIAMTKKAVQDPSKHIFVSSGSKKQDKDAITTMTTALWEEGITVSFWGHLSPERSAIRPIWLPPYQFKRTKHWLAYADYADRKADNTNVLTNGNASSAAKLVTPRGRSPDSWASLLFDIHQSTSRFTDIVSGHAVRGQPLCPASMYMECAVMAAQMIEPGPSAHPALHFENLSFQGALGINHGRDVVLVMEGAGEYLTWNYTVRSTPKHQTTRPTTHAKGKFSIKSPQEWQVYSRMVTDRVSSLRADANADRFTANRAYTLFSRVVSYGHILRGIDQIYMMGNQAMADIRRPRTQVSKTESTAVSICDAVSLDTFIQVAGLLVNSSETCPAEEVYIATHIDSITIQDCNFLDTGNNDSWNVYVMTTAIGDSRVGCDVFVLDKSGKLVVTAPGVQFTRYPITKLEKVLEHAAINSSSASPRAGSPKRVAVLSDVTNHHGMDDATDEQRTLVAKALSVHAPLTAAQVVQDPALRQLGLDSLSGVQLAHQLKPMLNGVNGHKPVGADTSGRMRIRQRIIELVSENSGASVSNIEDTACLGDIGIDSLSVVELKSSLEDAFGMRLSQDELALGSTIKEVLEFVQGSVNGAAQVAKGGHQLNGVSGNFGVAVAAY
ncbi:putative polyketide synthase [Apodospora peruviana]|uniref:Polyketide synthase n=1 Tax=Apodospora peruviana TaxID=516989 RepID=A0AAE0IGV1_9PEZI|nr:putative polyketide synthase [Apodospora peruviana]